MHASVWSLAKLCYYQKNPEQNEFEEAYLKPQSIWVGLFKPIFLWPLLWLSQNFSAHWKAKDKMAQIHPKQQVTAAAPPPKKMLLHILQGSKVVILF